MNNEYHPTEEQITAWVLNELGSAEAAAVEAAVNANTELAELAEAIRMTVNLSEEVFADFHQDATDGLSDEQQAEIDSAASTIVSIESASPSWGRMLTQYGAVAAVIAVIGGAFVLASVNVPFYPDVASSTDAFVGVQNVGSENQEVSVTYFKTADRLQKSPGTKSAETLSESEFDQLVSLGYVGGGDLDADSSSDPIEINQVLEDTYSAEDDAEDVQIQERLGLVEEQYESLKKTYYGATDKYVDGIEPPREALREEMDRVFADIEMLRDELGETAGRGPGPLTEDEISQLILANSANLSTRPARSDDPKSRQIARVNEAFADVRSLRRELEEASNAQENNEGVDDLRALGYLDVSDVASSVTVSEEPAGGKVVEEKESPKPVPAKKKIQPTRPPELESRFEVAASSENIPALSEEDLLELQEEAGATSIRKVETTEAATGLSDRVRISAMELTSKRPPIVRRQVEQPTRLPAGAGRSSSSSDDFFDMSALELMDSSIQRVDEPKSNNQTANRGARSATARPDGDTSGDSNGSRKNFASKDKPKPKPKPQRVSNVASDKSKSGNKRSHLDIQSFSASVPINPAPASARPAPAPEVAAESSPLLGDIPVEVGGSIRIRGRNYTTENLPADPDNYEGLAFTEQRTTINVKADSTDDVTAFIELDSNEEWGDEFRDKPDLHLYQSYIEMRPSDRFQMADATQSSRWRFQGDVQTAPPVTPGTEAYDEIIENSFRAVSEHPLSTFSIDVDTASYANVRRFLTNGSLPPADAVRVEELINYFNYAYEPPTGDHPFSANIEVASAPWQGQHRLVRVGLKGKEIENEERPPSNLVFLIDVSGSMSSSNKLPLVQKALRLLTTQLTENDRVAMVVYAGSSGVVLPSTSAESKNKIYAAIDRLQSGGSTNGGMGIQLAYKVAKKNFIDGGVNRVILATDGDFNVGVTNRSDLVRNIEQNAKSGVFLSVMGFGMGNLKDATMEQLADKGNGNYAYIDTYQEAKKVFVEEMAGTLVTIAKDVKIQVEFNPAQVQSYRLIGYENRALKNRDFNDDTKDAGEIGAGHSVTVLYEVVPVGVPGVNTGGVDELRYQTKPDPDVNARVVVPEKVSNEMLTVKLRYKQPDGHVSQLVEFNVKDNEARFAEASADFKFASAVATFGQLLRGSDHARGVNYDFVHRLAESGMGADKNGYRAEFMGLVRTAAQLNGFRVDRQVRLELLEIKTEGRNSKVRIDMGDRRPRWYEEGDRLGNFEILLIHRDGKSVNLYSEVLNKQVKLSVR